MLLFLLAACASQEPPAPESTSPETPETPEAPEAREAPGSGPEVTTYILEIDPNEPSQVFGGVIYRFYAGDQPFGANKFLEVLVPQVGQAPGGPAPGPLWYSLQPGVTAQCPSGSLCVAYDGARLPPPGGAVSTQCTTIGPSVTGCLNVPANTAGTPYVIADLPQDSAVVDFVNSQAPDWTPGSANLPHAIDISGSFGGAPVPFYLGWTTTQVNGKAVVADVIIGSVDVEPDQTTVPLTSYFIATGLTWTYETSPDDIASYTVDPAEP